MPTPIVGGGAPTRIPALQTSMRRQAASIAARRFYLARRVHRGTDLTCSIAGLRPFCCVQQLTAFGVTVSVCHFRTAPARSVCGHAPALTTFHTAPGRLSVPNRVPRPPPFANRNVLATSFDRRCLSGTASRASPPRASTWLSTRRCARDTTAHAPKPL
eukprot:643146-Pleurochrysis_carterae.AAC.2